MTAPTPAAAAAWSREVRAVWGRHLYDVDLAVLEDMAARAEDVDGVPVYAAGNRPIADVLARVCNVSASTARRGASLTLARLIRAEAISPSPGGHNAREFALNTTPGRAWLATSPAPGATWLEVRSSTTTAAEAALDAAEALADATAHRAATAPPPQAARARLTASYCRRRADALRGPAEAARAHLDALLATETP